MFHQIKSIYRKEWKDMVRDKRTLVAAFAYAVFGPIFLGFFINFIADMQESTEKTEVYIAGGGSAPGLVEFMKNQDVTIHDIDYQAGMETNPDMAEKQVGKSESVILIITPDHQQLMAEFKQVPIYLYSNQSRKENMMVQRKVRRMIYMYGDQIANMRLMARGVAPSIMAPYKLEVGDLSSSGAQGEMIAELMLLYFILAPFFASMSIAIDVTAGERERQSLQVLLAQPVSSNVLMLGKWAVAATFGIIGTVITVVLGALILSEAPLGALGIRLELDPVTIVSAILALIPLVLLVSTAQMFIGLFAKSFKEGQTYLTMLSFVPAMIGMMRSLTGKQFEGIAGYLPINAELDVLSNLLQDGSFNVTLWASGALLSLLFAALFHFGSSKMLDSERVLDGS